MMSLADHGTGAERHEQESVVARVDKYRRERHVEVVLVLKMVAVAATVVRSTCTGFGCRPH